MDDTREWFLKGTTLTYIPANGTDVSAKGTRVVGAVLKRVIEVEGAAALTLRGMTITHTAPTYMDSYEYPLPPCNTYQHRCGLDLSRMCASVETQY